MNANKFKPGDDKILALVNKEEERASGIIVQTERKPQTGVIISIGVLNRTNTKFPVGATIHFGHMAGYDVVIDDVTYKCFRNEEVLGYFE